MFSAHRVQRLSNCVFLRAGWCALLLTLARSAGAIPVATQFTLDSTKSNLNIAATAYGLTDSDNHPLAGTIDATFDFGLSGTYPLQAALTVTDAHVTPTANYTLRFSILETVKINDAVASAATINPPGQMNRTVGTSYGFDASQILLTIDQGTVVATGIAPANIDLAAAPVSGSAPSGVAGSIVLSNIVANGAFRTVDALLTMPIAFEQDVPIGSATVHINVTGTAIGNSQFTFPIEPVVADFDADFDVDGADLLRWQAGYGAAGGASTAQGDANGDASVNGADFLIWQRNEGTAPPVSGVVVAAPEPSALVIAALATLTLAGMRAVRARSLAA